MRLVFRWFTLVGVVLLVAWCVQAPEARAQLRIVSYNTATANVDNQTFTARNGVDVVLEAIGNESVGGIAKPIDVLLLQEQFTMSTSAQSFVDVLNDIYDPVNRTMYARSTTNGFTSSPDGAGGRPGLVYNTQTVDLLSEVAFGTANGSSQARQTLRYQLRPAGYDAASDFYVYNSHYKAGSSSSDRNRRLIEAQSIRNSADSLGQGTNIIYAGDFNIRSSSESMYSELLSAGNGQAFDPINSPGTWHNNSSVRATHTQAPSSSGQGDLVGGGIDDRFDFQLTSGELLDGDGLNFIPGSYRAFGNNGTHSCCNSSITSGTGAAANVLSALTTASDHLPVVADYQLPAVMDARLATLPSSIPVGANVSVDVLVENVANVMSSLGADELDYSISVTGDLLGSATGTDFALGGFNSHAIALDTTTAGPRSGTVTVSSMSQGAINTLINLPVNYTVGGTGSGPVFGLIAKDDFDSTKNLISFSQTPVAGTFSSAADGFEKFQVGVSPTIPFALVDDSFSEFPADQQGMVDASSDSPGFKSDTWFGVVDVENPDNPTGTATASWTFDISGAVGLEVSIDMTAMGDFDSADSFDWTFSIDGEAAQPLFTSSVDEAGSAAYELADGDVFNLDDPLLMTNSQGVSTQLTNDFQTLNSLLSESGDELTLMLTATTNGNDASTFNSESYAFDNIVIEGLTGANADFDQDGDVDGRDFLAWQRGLASGTTLLEGDANGDGKVDELDLDAWASSFGAVTPPASQAASAVPEPTGSILAIVFCMMAGTISRNHSRRVTI